jgi:succinyl-CoA synthetase beta subunit
MDLLEYQAKELFREIGIPVLPSQRIDDSRNLKRLQIPYPVVLKSQVRAGGRGRAGGIRFVENTIDAIAAARTIFNLSILGEYPQLLLAEARYDAEQEFFLAVVLDYKLQRPVLLGSSRGGMEGEVVLKQMQKVVVEDEFSPFYARRLALGMGLQGSQLQSVSTTTEKMYQLMLEKDLNSVEINPLGINANGEVMALDGKVQLNDSALGRHDDLISLVASSRGTEGQRGTGAEEQRGTGANKPTHLLRTWAPGHLCTETSAPGHLGTSAQKPPHLGTWAPSHSSDSPSQPRRLDWRDKQGNVGIISNDVDLALASWDLLSQEKGKLARCLVVAEEIPGNLLLTPSVTEQIGQALEQLLEVPETKVVLVNILCSPGAAQAVAEAIAEYLKPQQEETSAQGGEERQLSPTGTALRSPKERSSRSRSSRSSSSPKAEPQFVIRLVGGELDSVKERLVTMPVHWTDNLEEAVTQTVSLAWTK